MGVSFKSMMGNADLSGFNTKPQESIDEEMQKMREYLVDLDKAR